MSNEAEINIFSCLAFIKNNASKYAKAKAERVYLEEFRKSKKALLMKDAERAGHNAVSAQEREAYADEGYQQHLLALQGAVEAEEKLRWLMVAAQAKIEVWRTISANQRVEAKNI
ncbi:hypothetical protein [Burkholderia multivorans]|uniref:hypothetical protein n=1 Tax=Burkholderia multivorans TaxID=87883 RepID=UPI0020B20DC0|nr:hypothetical protein [Burkholderia multivorans]MCA8385318.1 hypothetical protein [Burkholderia multivorans]